MGDFNLNWEDKLKRKLAEFNEEIASLKWDDILSSQDVEYGCNTFINRVNFVRDKFTIQIQKKMKYGWFNDNLWKLMKTRDSALKMATKSGRDIDRLCYRGLQNKVVRELRVAKSSYYLHQLNEAKGNSKLIWKNVNSLLQKETNSSGDLKIKVQGNLILDDYSIATAFNNFLLTLNELGEKFAKMERNILPSDVDSQGFNLV